jgi:hypothetical protein
VNRAYAGYLGPLAFLTTIARECVTAGNVSTKLLHAWCALLIFAVLGALIGWLGGRIVADSVRAQIVAEMETQEKREPTVTTG